MGGELLLYGTVRHVGTACHRTIDVHSGYCRVETSGGVGASLQYTVAVIMQVRRAHVRPAAAAPGAARRHIPQCVAFDLVTCGHVSVASARLCLAVHICRYDAELLSVGDGAADSTAAAGGAAAAAASDPTGSVAPGHVTNYAQNENGGLSCSRLVLKLRFCN